LLPIVKVTHTRRQWQRPFMAEAVRDNACYLRQMIVFMDYTLANSWLVTLGDNRHTSGKEKRGHTGVILPNDIACGVSLHAHI